MLMCGSKPGRNEDIECTVNDSTACQGNCHQLPPVSLYSWPWLRMCACRLHWPILRSYVPGSGRQPLQVVRDSLSTKH